MPDDTPTLTQPIHGHVILREPTDDRDGLALILLDAGQVRWAPLAHADTDDG